MTTSPRVSPEVLDEAVAWQSCLLSGDATEDDIAACQQWRKASPAHELIWQRLQAIDTQFAAQPVGTHQLLRQARRHNRRAVLKSLFALAASGPLLYGAYDSQHKRRLFASLTTARGEQRELTLPDGSTLYINTHSSVDIDFNARERRIVLHWGEILIDSAPDTQLPKRDLVVHTPLADVQALGTRFIVRHDEQPQTHVFDGAIAVRHLKSGQQRHLNAGFGTQLSAQGIAIPVPTNPAMQSWTQGRIISNGMPLGEFVDEVNRYFPGYIFCTDEAARLQISGVYPLNDKDAILNAISQSLPIGLEVRTPYWTLINHQP